MAQRHRRWFRAPARCRSEGPFTGWRCAISLPSVPLRPPGETPIRTPSVPWMVPGPTPPAATRRHADWPVLPVGAAQPAAGGGCEGPRSFSSREWRGNHGTPFRLRTAAWNGTLPTPHHTVGVPRGVAFSQQLAGVPSPYTQKARRGRGLRGAAIAAPRGVPVDGDRGQVIVSSRR